jgi:hypothetical protein
MKDVPGTLKMVVVMSLVTLAFLAIQACAPFIQTGHGALGLIIIFPQKIVSEKGLASALKSINRTATYHIHLVRNDGTTRDFDNKAKIPIKTERVTTTELRKSLSSDDLTAIGSSITHHVYTQKASDIAVVLDQIAK